jgi:DNA-binding CsgD family transcriptional regulator
MKRWRVRPPQPPLDTAIVGTMLSGIGTPALAARMLAGMQGLLPVTFCTVFAVGADGGIQTVSAASSYGEAAERTAGLYAARRFDRVDPHMVWLAARPRPAQAQLWLGHHLGDELSDADYRAACYGDVGIRERASVLSLQPGGQRAAVSFYRSLAQPAFGAADFALLSAHAVLLAEATAAHGRVVGTPGPAAVPAFAARLQALSRREREVVARLASGGTGAQAAQELGLALSTVRTLQYRAFRKLGIATLKDLLRGAGGV